MCYALHKDILVLKYADTELTLSLLVDIKLPNYCNVFQPLPRT